MLKYGGWRFSRRAVAGVLTVILLFCLVRSVNATEDGCAVVLKTPDGFLNLRKAPTTKSDIVKQLKQGDFLYERQGARQRAIFQFATKTIRLDGHT
jgi:hypothetical protein